MTVEAPAVIRVSSALPARRRAPSEVRRGWRGRYYNR